MFNSVREGMACVWSLDMALDNIAACVVSWGEMKLYDCGDYDVKSRRTFDYKSDMSWRLDPPHSASPFS